jgi:hypothetical protein
MSEKDENPKAWVDGEYRQLTEREAYEINRGRKALKTNGKSEYVYIDAPERGKTFQRISGPNYTPPKKKRKK